MYHTYKSEEIPKEESMTFEERLIPKEVNEDIKICSVNKEMQKDKTNPLSNLFGGIFSGIDMDDMLILGLLILLFYESCEDNIIIIILVALLFLK